MPLDESTAIYVSDIRRRSLAAFLGSLLISLASTYYAQFVAHAFWSNLNVLAYPYALTVTLGLINQRYRRRIEFYKSFLRITARNGESRDIRYTDIGIVRLWYNSYGLITSFLISAKGEQNGKTWRIPNSKIKTMKATVYDLIMGEMKNRTVIQSLKDVPRFWTIPRIVGIAAGIAAIAVAVGYFWSIPATPESDFIDGLVLFIGGLILIAAAAFSGKMFGTRAIRKAQNQSSM